MPTSVPLQPTVTQDGVTALFNAQSTGVEFAISHIAFGTGQYVPTGLESELQAEMVRVTIAGGGRISPTQIQIYAIAIATAGDPFFAGEIGFFGNNGATLLAVYSNVGTPKLYMSDTVTTSVSYALGLAALPANSVTVTIDPSASAALLIIGNHVAAADPHPQYVEKVNGVAVYDPEITYNLNAEIIGDDGLIYQSAIASNIGNLPSASPADWVPLFNYGSTPITGLAASDVTLTSTQAARAHIVLTGTPTVPLNVIFPKWVKDWTVVNSTTGGVSVTCKTAAGTGVIVGQGFKASIHGDGTNIVQKAEQIVFGAQDVSTTGKVYGVNSPNLQYNGSAEFGVTGWSAISPLSAAVDTLNGLGSYFTNTSALAAVTASQRAKTFAIGPNVKVSLAADVGTLGVTAGTVSIYASCLDSSGASLGTAGVIAIPIGVALDRYPATFVTPANTAYVSFGSSLTGVTATAKGLVLRQIKLEAGDPSLYTQEASLAAFGIVTNGYFVLPNGNMLQKGVGSLTTGNGDVVTLPIAFPNAIAGVVGSDQAGSCNPTSWAPNGSSKSSFLGYGKAAGTNTYSATTYSYLAWGS